VLTNWVVTAYVQIPALRDTLPEKHVIKILKCFTISAAPCTWEFKTQICVKLAHPCTEILALQVFLDFVTVSLLQYPHPIQLQKHIYSTFLVHFNCGVHPDNPRTTAASLCSDAKWSLELSDRNENWNDSTFLRKILQHQIYNHNPIIHSPVGLRADGQVDRFER